MSAAGVVALFECGQVRPTLRFQAGRALTASHAAISWGTHPSWAAHCGASESVDALSI
jgi:hypothetical protein